MQVTGEQMRGLFTRIAGRYDALNRALTCGVDVLWRRRALALLEAPTRALDLATGTADLALGLARRFPSAEVTGVDLTPAMLEIGRRKIRAAGVSDRVTLVEGDAAALAFPDAAYDVVACAFGFRNFANRGGALAEAARVLKPGGTLLVLELFRMESRLWARATSLWLRLVSPFLAGRAKGEYAYLRASIERTATADEFTAEATRVGFSLVRAEFFRPSCHCLIYKNMVK